MGVTGRRSNPYEGFFFSPEAASVMRDGNILPEGDSATSLLSELIKELVRAEKKFGTTEPQIDRLVTHFYDYVRRGMCILGSPLLTNIAAKHPMLASCTAVPVSSQIASAADLDMAEAYYNLNMGSGYDLTNALDPCDALVRLNDHSEKVESSGSCERYVGNIAHVSVFHPRVLDFISIKTRRSDIIHFNISVDVNDRFMNSVAENGTFTDLHGVEHRSNAVWDAIVDSAWECGDPGIMSLERYNSGNPLATCSPYVTTAPCAEVGLSPGEVCVFGYINLAACLSEDSGCLDFSLLGDVADTLTRVLDDALELSIIGSPVALTSSVLTAKRKIGISVCGLADVLLWLGIDYGSEASKSLLIDALATVNYRSKLASTRLARERGRFGNFDLSTYASDASFLARFGAIKSRVPAEDWRRLASTVMKCGLRNVMTTALPPSGRSALLLGVSPSIEPYLTLAGPNRSVLPLQTYLNERRVAIEGGQARIVRYEDAWPQVANSDTSLFRIATEISPQEHLEMLKVAAQLVDDGVSKTINLPPETTKEIVDALLRDAWKAGVKAISVYRQKANAEHQ